MKRQTTAILLSLICSTLLGYASTDSANELKAYFSKQKALLLKEFPAPKINQELSLTSKDNKPITGQLIAISDESITLASATETNQYTKAQLSSTSCVKLFAEEYAQAGAIQRTRVYKEELAKKNAPTTGRIAAKNQIKRDEEKPEVSEKQADTIKGDPSIRTITVNSKTEQQHVDVTLQNTSPKSAIFQLEWYFLAKPKNVEGRKEVFIYEAGDKSFKVEANEKVTHQISSKKLHYYTRTESVRLPERGNNENEVYKESQGDTSEGYILILKSKGEILDIFASSKKYASKEWIEQCDEPVRKLSPEPPSWWDIYAGANLKSNNKKAYEKWLKAQEKRKKAISEL